MPGTMAWGAGGGGWANVAKQGIVGDDEPADRAAPEAEADDAPPPAEEAPKKFVPRARGGDGGSGPVSEGRARPSPRPPPPRPPGPRAPAPPPPFSAATCGEAAGAVGGDPEAIAGECTGGRGGGGERPGPGTPLVLP